MSEAALLAQVGRPPRRLRRYDEYKGSGLQWLRAIPAHWSITKLKNVAQVHLSNVDKKTVEGQVPVRLCNYVDVYHNERITERLEFMKATATPEQVQRLSLRPGDVLITKDSESWADIAVPAVVVGDLERVLCGYHLALVRTDATRMSGLYLARAFAATGLREQFQVAANGITRFGIGRDAIRGALFPVPPLSEQHAITAFIDRETAKIDALVAKNDRLIGLLEEKRVALVTRAVTKGLVPNVAMKESDVDWLGRIPEHWQVRPLKWAVTFQRGHDLPADEREDGNVPVVSSSGVSSSHSRKIASAPGIVTGRYGTVGQFHLMEQDYWPLNTTLYSIDLHGNDPRYLLHLLRSLSPLFLLNAVKSAVPGIDRNDVHALATVVPPVADQQAIADYLDNQSASLDALIAKVRTAIAHFHELRTALISAAITGKIDVREEVAP